MTVHQKTLIIACGALAREISLLIDLNRWHRFDVTCLPANLHNRPQLITGRMAEKITVAKQSGKYDQILAGYGDCGTGGDLDRLLDAEGVIRLPGAHCYEFFATTKPFDKMVDDEIGTFFLTDYLVRFFDTLIIKGLALDRHPELLPDYFGAYKRLMYLAQTEDEELDKMAEQAAIRLGLEYHKQFTGYGDLATFLETHSGGSG